ncbi:MAG: glycosyltransferase family 2 protein [Deltaproteobacteria bacterium]|nr:glycosyltransferase family 2 protein [Deltaproteobacteria bacterium]
MRICAVIPAYNNEKTISSVVEGTRAHIRNVIVVDDGSTDGTGELAMRAGARVIAVGRNRGKGHALKISFRRALVRGFDGVLTLDADLQHDPGEIPKFVEYYSAHRPGIVVGDRMHGRELIPRGRYVPNRVGTYAFSWLTGQPIPDSQCGFRLYDRRVLEEVPILHDGFEAETDLLLRAAKRGYHIGFVPIRTIYFEKSGGRSAYRPVRDTFRISIVFLMNLFWKDR